MRTETTINNTYDFRIGKRLINLSKLREIGFAANRRLLEVERLSHDCILAEDRFQHINNPVSVNGQRVSGLRFADPRVHPLWHAIILNRLLRPGLAASYHHSAATQLRQTFHTLDNRITRLLADGRFAPQLDTCAKDSVTEAKLVPRCRSRRA